MYSLRDLIDANSQILLPELREIVQNFLKHIKTDCKVIVCSSLFFLYPFFTRGAENFMAQVSRKLKIYFDVEKTDKF